MTIAEPTTAVSVYINSAWADITSDVLGSMNFNWGIRGNKSTDLVADAGTLRMTLDNSTRCYTPGSDTMLTGWKKGAPIAVDITLEGDTYRRFYGIIEDIKIDSGRYGNRKASIKAIDWMGYPTKNHLVQPTVLADQLPEHIIDDIIGQLPIAPIDKSYDGSITTLPQSYDTSTAETKAYSEMTKVADSEVGYLFVRKTKFDGEELVFQGNHARKGTDPLSKVPLAASESSFMLMEDGFNLLQETGDKIILDETENAEFIGTSFIRLDAEYGKDIINRFILKVEPKTEDGTAAVLFSISEPITIPANTGGLAGGAVITLRGSYRDASGQPCSGKDMIDPVASTDYLFNTLADGTGTDKTAFLGVSAVYSASYVDYSFVSSYTGTGYITLLQARGTGIYSYQPLEYIAEDGVSIDEYGEQPGSLAQLYKNDMTYGKIAANSFIERDKYARHDLKKVYFNANKDNGNMMAFLSMDIGDRVYITETDATTTDPTGTQTGIDGWYYIQNIDATVYGRNIIMFTWGLRQFFSLQSGLSLMSCETAQSGVGISCGGINFGQLPYLWNVSKRSISFWVYPTAIAAATDTVLSLYSDTAGFKIYLSTNATPFLGITQKAVTTAGIWRTANSTITLNAWNHVVITRDSSNTTTKPVIYINGTELVVTESTAQVGAIKDETGCELILNNHSFTGEDYVNALNGKLMDVRLYNDVILTQAQVTELYNAGAITTACNEYLRPNIEFQAPSVMTSRYSEYIGLPLTSGLNLIDNIYFVIGTPINTVTGRTST